MSNRTVYILLILLLMIHWGLVAYYIGFKP